MKLQDYGDPEISTRIAQYEMAFRMQTSVPELTDFSKEPAARSRLYGPDARKPGTFAYNCLLARRLAERGVRFIQLYPPRLGPSRQPAKGLAASAARKPTSPRPALVQDLKQRGMLDDTLVVWGGEFGRTVYCQGTLTADDYGRDHHPRCFTMWFAGGGMKPGMTPRRDRRLLLQHNRPCRPRARYAGHNPALPRHRSHTSHLEVPGPELPPDRRAR